MGITNYFTSNLYKCLKFLMVGNEWVWPQYRIKGCKNYFYLDLIEQKIPSFMDISFQEQNDYLLTLITKTLHKKKPLSILRLGDGEFYFIKNNLHGNILKRHLTDKIKNINFKQWIENTQKNDILCFSSNIFQKKLWQSDPKWKIIYKKSPFKLNSIYAIVANKNLFKILSNYKVGLIGAETKIKIIKKLCSNNNYLNYLQLKKPFHNYIGIPQTGSCNEPDLLLNDIKVKVKKKPCDIYLFGMGISKLYMISYLRDFTKAIFLDVGHGIDGLAGIIPKDRQYFGEWTNYKIKDYDYSDVDFLKYYTPKENLKFYFNLNKDITLNIV